MKKKLSNLMSKKDLKIYENSVADKVNNILTHKQIELLCNDDYFKIANCWNMYKLPSHNFFTRIFNNFQIDIDNPDSYIEKMDKMANMFFMNFRKQLCIYISMKLAESNEHEKAEVIFTSISQSSKRIRGILFENWTENILIYNKLVFTKQAHTGKGRPDFLMLSDNKEYYSIPNKYIKVIANKTTLKERGSQVYYEAEKAETYLFTLGGDYHKVYKKLDHKKVTMVMPKYIIDELSDSAKINVISVFQMIELLKKNQEAYSEYIGEII